MFEVLIIFCFIYSAKYRKLQGKTFEELSEKEKNFVIKSLYQDFFRKSKHTPETYLDRLQKLATPLLIIGFSIMAMYLAIIIGLISTISS